MKTALILVPACCLASLACGTGNGQPDVAADIPAVPETFTIMTFNVGTSSFMAGEDDPSGYTTELVAIQAAFFGNNLAWLPAAAGVRDLIDQVRPDIVAFQEMYYDVDCEADCEEIAQDDPDLFEAACNSDQFPCKEWHEGGDIAVRRVLGPDYAVACAPGHPDNCVGVLKDFGTLAGCDDGPCIDGLDGMAPPNGCTKGARVATAVVHVHAGPTITVVDVHTTAGLNEDCRKAQFQQVFEDRGDGKPATYGDHNIVLGDMNIDPFDTYQAAHDDSVKYWNEQVGPDKDFGYISSSDASGPYTHPVTMTHLDHVVSDTLTGSCEVRAAAVGNPPTTETTFFDHRPVFCTVRMP